MIDGLTSQELVDLIKRVFTPGDNDRRMVFLVDMPDEQVPDNPAWRARREMAAEWASLLSPLAAEIGLEEVQLALYNNPHANNANLPATARLHPTPVSEHPLPPNAERMTGEQLVFDDVFERFQILVAPTQFSATAPLKMAAREFGFRAATMPGFSESMIPALRIDYGVVGQRVNALKRVLDDATRCEILFDAEGVEHRLTLDLRHREGYASGGVFPETGTAGNLPSGESYIVPYEGEFENDPTGSKGEIPVQLGKDVVVYKIVENVAVEAITDNEASKIETKKLIEEPAYGNIAELGLGVLGDLGLEPTGEILLDEKLGLHIAFGRSEHFGGQVGPTCFSSPDKVVHIDRVYIPQLQPKVSILEANLIMGDGSLKALMKNGEYVLDMG